MGGVGVGMNCRKSCSGGKARIQRIGEARRALEARAREQAESAGKKPEEAEPTPKTQYNFTDPESRIMKGPEGFVQAYNTQIAVEPNFQLIVGQTVTPAANDKQQMTPLVEAIREQSGQKPEEVLADSGYCSEGNLKYLRKKRIEGFVATEKQKHGERRAPCKRGPLSKNASRVERMQRKLGNQGGGGGVSRCARRSWSPVFGQIKQARGFRQFLLRGLAKVRGEWGADLHDAQYSELHKICYG